MLLDYTKTDLKINLSLKRGEKYELYFLPYCK